MDDAEFEELPEIEPSWLRLQRATTLRKRLLAAGYMPLPCNGKAPPIPGWQDIIATSKLIDTWEHRFPDATNTGVLTDISPAIDIDIMHPDAAATIEALAREHFEEHGYILVRFGKAPKRAILLRTNEPFNKIARMFTAPDGTTQKIEILATGQQIVVAGIHPDTKRDYSWHGGMPGEIARADLPYVREADVCAFIDAAAALLISEFAFTSKDNSKRHKANGGEQPQPNGPAGIREKAYTEAALEGCVAELAAAAAGGRNELLNKLAFRLGRMVARGWINRADVEAELIGAMHANGAVADDGLAAAEATLRSGLDAGEKEPHPDLDEQKNNDNASDDETWEDAAQSHPLIIKSSKEFVAGFVPPEYVVIGLLQRRFFYAFTGQTGAGKTAIMLLLSACVALGRSFAGRDTKPIRVLYLAAENADDVRMRWIAFAQQMDFDINTIKVYFVEGRFSLSKSLQTLRTEAERHGGEFGIVVVDTGPTFFEGKDENENKQLGDHARMLRSLIDTIPGAPCVVANCHPTKNAQPDQLLPRGGGAFLAEADGNLTATKTDSTVELHWQGKFRGPDFAPMYFLIRTVTHQDLKDSDSRLIPTVIAEYITDETKEDIAAAAQHDEDAVLAFISTNPAASQITVATAMGWKLYNGQPNKMKAGRCIKALVKAKLIKMTRAGRYKLTPEGEKALNDEEED
jgi:AAA domain/Bifunctional DNA primase/polymerase, N-terminal